MGTKKIGLLEKLFTIYVCLIPILEYYNGPFNLVNFSTFLAILFGCLFLFAASFNKKTVNKTMVGVSAVYLVFVSINVITTSLLYNYGLVWGNISAYVRLIALFFCVLLLGGRYFDFSFALKSLRVVVCLSSVLIFLQFLMKNMFGYSFHPVIVSWLRDKGYAEAGSRFSGLYMEPAHFAFSASLYLILELFSIHSGKRRLSSALLAIMGVILSGSGQGYLFLLIILIFWLLQMFYLSKKNSRYFFIALGALVSVFVLGVVGIQIPYIQYSLSRIISEGGSFGGLALEGRISTRVFFESLPVEQKWTGIGFGHIKSITSLFVSSFYTHLIECGYLSVPLLLVIVLPAVFDKKYYKVVLAVFYGLTVFFSSGANPATLTLIIPFFYLDGFSQGERATISPLTKKSPDQRLIWSRQL